MTSKGFVGLFFLISLMSGCQNKPLLQFSLTEPSQTGIAFVNRVEENHRYNILSDEYTHNGGGVSAADFNNDGFVDLYFTGNLEPNALYLNVAGIHGSGINFGLDVSDGDVRSMIKVDGRSGDIVVCALTMITSKYLT